MHYQETEKLMQRANALERGIAVTQKLIDQIEIPGGIESIQQDSRQAILDKYPHRILGTPISRVSLLRESVLDQARVLDEKIPTVLKQAHQALARKNSALEEISLQTSLEKTPSITEQGEELILREQIFTQTQAIIIATTILHKDDVSFITPNNTVLYTFTIGDDVRPILSEIASLPVNREYGDLSDQQRLELRNNTLSELDSLLSNHSLLNQAYEENKFGQNLQELLIWLSEQNDAVGGKLCELLTLPVLQSIVIDGRRLDMLDSQKYARLPGELARYIRMASNLGVSSKPKQEEKMPGISSNPPVVVSALSHEQPAMPKIFDIERRDPQIRELISGYIRLIAENNITKPVSGAQVSYFFPRIKKTDLEKALERKYISPERGRELFPVYGPKEILILLYIRNHGNNLTARHIKDLQDIVEEELSKQGKPQG